MNVIVISLIEKAKTKGNTIAKRKLIHLINGQTFQLGYFFCIGISMDGFLAQE